MTYRAGPVVPPAEMLDAATEFTFGPKDNPDAHPRLVISAVWRGGDRWAVRDGRGYVLNGQGHFEYERWPSSRDDGFLARCRFSRDEAIRIAATEARLRGVGG